MLGEVDLLLVIGSRNSSNSNRLVEVARAHGVAAHLIDDETDDRRDVARRRRRRSGVTSGRVGAGEARRARVRLVPRPRRRGHLEPYRLVEEDVEFRLPVELRRELALAESQALASPRVAEAVDRVVVDEAARLHERVADRRADEAEPALLQVFAHAPSTPRSRPGARSACAQAVHLRLAVDEAPEVVAEAVELAATRRAC